MSRLRSYRICINNDLAFWNLNMSFQQLADKLIPNGRGLVMNADDMFVATPADMAKATGSFCCSEAEATMNLNMSGVKHLMQAKISLAHKVVWDLSQNPDARPRGSLKDKSLPCFATSTLLWSKAKKRQMLGAEMMDAIGIPCSVRAACAATAERFDMSDISESGIRHMAGNAMHVPCVGFAMLCAAVCVKTRI